MADARTVDTNRDYFERVDGSAQIFTGPVYMHGQPTLSDHPRLFHNLPQPDYGQFVGRETELAQLRKLLSPRSRHFVITIDGIGGIGKSALALEIAHQFLHHYNQLPEDERFEAIIWTSAKQTVLTGEGIRTRRRVLHSLSDIYTASAVALQREDIMRANAEMQDEVVYSALTRQRTLLIVDNLETVDDEAVLDFLRELPAPTKAIVTTRHRLDVAYPIRLTGMPWEDARQLIAQECVKKTVSLDEENMRRLFDRTGGVPLAIVWSIAQMGFGYSPEAVLQRLGQPTSDIARFCFAGAIERIKTRPAYRLLLTLSLCADSASREALGYATELPELDRDDGLVELEKLSLVNKQEDRFWLLPLTKEFVAAEFQKSINHKERLQGKWAEYFEILSKEYESDYWNWTNYDWLLAEGENILAIVDRAIATGKPTLALAFTRALQRLLNNQGRRPEVEYYGKSLLNLAKSLPDKQTWAWICINWLFGLYRAQGDLSRVEEYLIQGISLYKEMDDVKGLCFALTYQGRLLRRRKLYQEAEARCQEAWKLAKQHSYGDGIAVVHFELGKLTRDLEQWEEAKAHFEAVLDWCENHQDEANLDIQSYMGALGNLGWVEYHLENYQRSRELLERSLSFIGRFGGKGHAAILHLRLAHVEYAMKKPKKAWEHLQETCFWAERLNMERELEGAHSLRQELQQAEIHKEEEPTSSTPNGT